MFVVGAGFSRYAGLPTQREFTKALLDVSEFPESAPSSKIVEYLTRFVQRVFGLPENAKPRKWPELEDIFTNIDLAANTGHHLGSMYRPAELRTLRRALIARTIRMLRQRYNSARDIRDSNWEILESFFRQIDLGTTAFVNMNWDTVIEQNILENHDDYGVDYGCNAIWARFPRRGRTIEISNTHLNRYIPVIKMHGSTNWLYCDNCRNLFAFPPRDNMKIADQLLSREDWKRIDRDYERRGGQWKCGRCQTVTLGARLATFSYLKALEFPMFQKSWFLAEHILQHADSWIFIGYSMPPADFEFKHLLKRVELSRPRTSPQVILVTGGDKAGLTRENYEKFFGDIKVFEQGITEEALDRIVEMT